MITEGKDCETEEIEKMEKLREVGLTSEEKKYYI
ncbi:unnamed protein product, partial [marine sediment metagenome]